MSTGNWIQLWILPGTIEEYSHRAHAQSQIYEGCMFADLKFRVVTGSRYLGGFIGEKPAFDEWIRKKTKSWTEAVLTDLAVVAKNFPQSAYSGLQKSLQQECSLYRESRRVSR
jgi:hypothetical protein